MAQFPFSIRKNGEFHYVDEGSANGKPPVVLLHGMLGQLSNWTDSIWGLSEQYRVLVPMLPVYDMPLKQTNVPGLRDYVHAFLNALGLKDPVVLMGNSLGGQVALFYAHRYPERTCALVLAGSSGLYEIQIGNSTPRRYDPEFIRRKAELTFYDPRHVTDELIAEMGDLITNRGRTLRLIKMARSAKQEGVDERLPEIDIPTLLVWGANDNITPPDVAEEFKAALPDAELHFIDQCGHAPMMEQPVAFNALVLDFLQRTLSDLDVVPVSVATVAR